MLALFLAVGLLSQLQSQKLMKFEQLPVLNTEQWRSLEVDTEDKEIIVFDDSTQNYMMYNGNLWVNLGDGGLWYELLMEYQDLLETDVDQIREMSEMVNHIPRLKKKDLKKIRPNDEKYKNTLVYSGGYQIYNGQSWSNLGKGGDYAGLINKQKSIVGLKDKFTDKWRRSFGFGLYVGQTYNGFYRNRSYPSNPFLNDLATGWEVGVNQNLVYKKYFQSRVYVGWNQFNAQEVFSEDDGRRIVANWKISGPKMGFLPIMITPGTDDFKLSLGVGGYGRYHLNKEFAASDNNTVFTLETTDVVEHNLEYGFLGQVGFQVYRFFLDINFYNQANTLLESNDSENVLDKKEVHLKGFSVNLTYNF